MKFPEKTMKWGRSRNCIRELFEYGIRRKAEIGAENVYDFSLGNPSIPAPDCVNEAIARLVREQDPLTLHGYSSAPGRASLRAAIADYINSHWGDNVEAGDIFVTCGAAAGIAAFLRGVLMPGDEVITFAPFFPEYTVWTQASGGVLVPVPSEEGTFQIDLAAFEAAITEKTRVVIVNSPNNPSGVVLNHASLQGLSDILRAYSEKFGKPIYLLSDEPYRELVYDGIELPCLMNYYDNTVICYSFSKALSIPGERIGYLAVCKRLAYREEVNFEIAGASRALGHINAPSLLQQVIEEVIGATSDISKYKENRDILCGGLEEMGYSCVRPDGAFYLFVKALEPDAKAFSERAKAHELLLCPADDFGVSGYVRISYCVDKDMIIRSMPAFKALIEEYK